MRESRAQTTAVALFAVAGCALIAATTLTTVVLSADTPEPCCTAAETPLLVEQPKASVRSAKAREGAELPLCLIGTWRSVEDVSMVKFYRDVDPIRLSGSGRTLQFRPDGTATERQDNFTLTGLFAGRVLRLVGNGSVELRWKADSLAITYLGHISASSFTFSYYDHRGLIDTQPFKVDPNLNEVDQYTCRAGQLTEAGKNGYHSTWVRTTASGVYGS